MKIVLGSLKYKLSLINVKIDSSQLYCNAEWLQSVIKYSGIFFYSHISSIEISDAGLQS